MNREQLKQQIQQCQQTINKNFFIIGLGGKDSWATTLAAYDAFGKDSILAVNIYSIFSNSIMPYKMSALCQEYSIPYCDIDISPSIQETLFLSIGLMRVEQERLHYYMTDLQKNEIIAMLRSVVLRGITDRHDGILLSGINASKITAGWASPSYSMFDWNPLVNCTHSEVKSIIEEYNMGIEIIDMLSGLDLNTRGGPFPTDYGIDLDNPTEKPTPKNFGKGLYQ